MNRRAGVLDAGDCRFCAVLSGAVQYRCQLECRAVHMMCAVRACRTCCHERVGGRGGEGAQAAGLVCSTLGTVVCVLC